MSAAGELHGDAEACGGFGQGHAVGVEIGIGGEERVYFFDGCGLRDGCDECVLLSDD